MRKNWFFLCVFMCWLAFFSKAHANDTLEKVSYYIDSLGQLSLQDVEALESTVWRAGHPQDLRFSFENGNLWIKIERDQIPLSAEALDLNYPSIDKAEAFFVGREGVLTQGEVGFGLSFESRALRSFTPVFRIPTEVESWQTAYIRVWTRAPLQAPVQVKTLAEVSKKYQNEILLFGAFMGMMLAFFVVSYLHGQHLGRAKHFAYCAHIVLTAFCFSLVQYHPIAFIYPQLSTAWAPHAVIFFSQLYTLSFLLVLATAAHGFVSFLNSRIFWFACVFVLGGTALLSLVNLGPAVIGIAHLNLALCLALVFVVCFKWRRQSSALRQLLLAKSITVVAVMLFLLHSMGLLKQGGMALMGFYIDTAVEMGVLVFGISKQVKLIALEKEQLRISEHRVQLELQEQLKELAQERAAYARDKLATVARLSDRFNSPFMALNISLESLRSYFKRLTKKTAEGKEVVTAQAACEFWAGYEGNINEALTKLMAVSKELAELREAHQELETTELLFETPPPDKCGT